MKEKITELLSTVMDPEIPVLSIVDLGILQDVIITGNQIEIWVTPTYSACPAMDAIRDDIQSLLAAEGYDNIIIRTRLSPAWTTDWMSAAGKNKLRAYGIAAPELKGSCASGTLAGQPVQCPQCHSMKTELISAFGSTACKALYRCNDCLEAFDYFKCH